MASLSEASANRVGQRTVAPVLTCSVGKLDGGNVNLTLRASEMLGTFACGDVLSVAFDGRVVDLPLVSAYSGLDSGASGLVVREKKDACVLVTNMGGFATAYGITEGTSFAIGLKEAGGYLEDLRYDYLARHGIVLSLERAFGVEDLTAVDLASRAQEYLRGIGLTQGEVAALRSRLA